MAVSNNDITLVINRIGELFGIRVLENQQAALLRNLSAAAKDMGNSLDDENLLKWFLSSSFDSRQLGILSRHLTVGETYFFRESTALNLFSEQIIPNHLAAEKTLRIWCAGCSTGEEPYTLAMIIDQRFADNLKFSILATDLNPDAIEKAKTGIYTNWSFRDTPPEFKYRYFSERGNLFEIDKKIRKMVTFGQMNLVSGNFPAITGECEPYDVIFCRNVLMYLRPETVKEISAKFYQSLNEGGWLITSQVELSDDYFGQFKREIYQNNIFYHKISTVSSTFSMNTKSLTGLDFQQESVLYQKKKRTDQQRRDLVSGNKPVMVKTHFETKVPVNETFEELFTCARYEDCVCECRKLLTKQVGNKAIYPKLILSLANLGHLAEAAEISDKWIEIDSANPEAYYISATIHVENGDLAKAEKMLLKSLYLKSDFHPALLSLGNVLNKLGKKQLAIKQYQNLLRSLENMNDPEIVSHFEGMTAGRLRQIAEIMIQS